MRVINNLEDSMKEQMVGGFTSISELSSPSGYSNASGGSKSSNGCDTVFKQWQNSYKALNSIANNEANSFNKNAVALVEALNVMTRQIMSNGCAYYVPFFYLTQVGAYTTWIDPYYNNNMPLMGLTTITTTTSVPKMPHN